MIVNAVCSKHYIKKNTWEGNVKLIYLSTRKGVKDLLRVYIVTHDMIPGQLLRVYIVPRERYLATCWLEEGRGRNVGMNYDILYSRHLLWNFTFLFPLRCFFFSCGESIKGSGQYLTILFCALGEKTNKAVSKAHRISVWDLFFTEVCCFRTVCLPNWRQGIEGGWLSSSPVGSFQFRSLGERKVYL